MSDRTRYQAQTIYQEQGDVTSYLGVDPVTGLPVLIYRFSGAASPQLARLDSEFLPRLLAWRDDDSGGIMVVSWSSALVPVAGEPLDNLQLLDSARALNDAAAAGVSHGDLSPERFLLAGDSIVIEGFGVPWTAEPATPEGDVVAWAGSIRQMGHRGNSGVDKLLDDIEAGSGLQPSELFGRLTDLLLRGEAPQAEPAAEQTPPPAAETAEPEADFLDRTWDDFSGQDEQYPAFTGSASQVPEVETLELDFSADEHQGAEEPEIEEPDTGVFTPSSTYASERLSARERAAAQSAAMEEEAPAGQPAPPPAEETGPEPAEEPVTDRRPPPPQSLPAGGSSSYLKSLDSDSAGTRTARSVGVTGQSGSTSYGRPVPAAQEEDWAEEQPVQRNNRRIIMITVLAILTVVLVTLLVVLRQRDLDRVPASANPGVAYVIDVLVEPDDLPPVNLFVLQSPGGSQFAPNTALGTAPRRVALDAEGTWVFEGRFQGRLSEPVTIQIPEDRSSTVTIVIPPEQGDAQ